MPIYENEIVEYSHWGEVEVGEIINFTFENN